MLLGVVQARLNRWIAQSTAAKSQIARLEGRAMQVHFAGIERSILIRAVQGRLLVNNASDDQSNDNVNVELAARPMEFLQLAQSASVADIGAADIELRGSVQVAEGFSRLFKLAVPEFEDELAAWLGDTPALGIAKATRRVFAGIDALRQTFERSASEYLHAETKLCPTNEEIEQFANAVEGLRDDVARIEQRVARLDRSAQLVR